MNKPNSTYVGQPAKPVNHVAAVDGDAGVVLVASLLLAVLFWVKLKPAPTNGTGPGGNPKQCRPNMLGGPGA